jgi:L-lactate dehydrogenase complex protein LldG
MVEAAAGSVAGLSSAPDVSAAVSAVLRSQNLPMKARRSDDPRLAALPWGEQRALEVTTGASDGHQLASVSRAFGVAALPRAVNMITGPSRSTDIGQILILGAHGPRRLHVLVVGETS